MKALIPIAATAILLVGCTGAAPAAADGDGDGVENSRDVCPSTPSDAGVDRFGCALDADFDGVIDLFDRCPGTNMTTLVGPDGCETKK
jgi:hypothetical protein